MRHLTVSYFSLFSFCFLCFGLAFSLFFVLSPLFFFTPAVPGKRCFSCLVCHALRCLPCCYRSLPHMACHFSPFIYWLTIFFSRRKKKGGLPGPLKPRRRRRTVPPSRPLLNKSIRYCSPAGAALWFFVLFFPTTYLTNNFLFYFFFFSPPTQQQATSTAFSALLSTSLAALDQDSGVQAGLIKPFVPRCSSRERAAAVAT